jgi:divalent metal cation (Fe/Co/Zn/Cd) transporter
VEETVNLLRKAIRIERVSILWMFIEAGVAISAGIAAHSLALIAFGADSVIELVAGFVLLWRLTIESRGIAGESLRKAEVRASWGVGLALLLLSAYIVISAAYNLLHHEGPESSTFGVVLAIVAGLVMPYLAWSKKKIGRAIGSKALVADGSCSMVCAYMSWVLLLGVLATALLGWWWIDAVASLLFVYFVASEGIEAIQAARRGEGPCACCSD